MEKLKVLKRGAESIIYEGYFLGYRAIFKERRSKPYRDPSLDKKINTERTMMEAHFIYNALKIGVNTPAIFYIDKESNTLVLEYIDGVTVRETDCKDEVTRKMGEYIALLHMHGIAHGDVNPNNFIVNEKGELFLIDFGLAKRTDDIEDFGTDIEVFYRSLETMKPDVRDKLISTFMEGYSDVAGKERAFSVLDAARRIRSRGRYVSREERKKYVFDYEDD
ncbi:Kae1-associated kinase Bud32 [Sulfuracidifex tepidarius]|uniref:non-specific serine/threonine protein kinase n=1 Tax=Sulfuracidifex tepidarius TaxID=1294262 RepID=A0A510DW76_9CREN|nr:Kae1-associated kinase Bud32 [Sulfuracidifex tepidarius]BBG24218.1 KEOPS complex subunit Bud32 [Sulfuracidifex tepidarius]BBG26975.1 KEOPS complex subunit Bud32 [Sulfuracidifex tepidarius]